MLFIATLSISVSGQDSSDTARSSYSKHEISIARISVLIHKKNWEKISEYGATAVEPLVKALDNSDPEIRMKSAEALGIIGDKYAVEPLIGIINDEDWHVRQQVVKALGKLRESQAVEPLIGCLKDLSREVRLEVVIALKTLADDKAFEHLLQCIYDPDASVRSETVKALLMTGGERVVEPFIDYLNDSNSLSKVEVIRALGVLGDKRAVGQMVLCLKDKSPSVRMWAVDALGRIGDKRAIEPLKRCMEDPEAGVRDRALEALKKFNVEPRPPQVAAPKTDKKTEIAVVTPTPSSVPAIDQSAMKIQAAPAETVKEARKPGTKAVQQAEARKKNSSVWWLYGIVGAVAAIIVALKFSGIFPASTCRTSDELSVELEKLTLQIREISRKRTNNASSDAALDMLEPHATAFTHFPLDTCSREDKKKHLGSMDEAIAQISGKLGSGHKGIRLLRKMRHLVKKAIDSGCLDGPPARS